MSNGNTKVERAARLRWVPIAAMRVSPVAQRDLKQYRVDHLVANLDLEQIGTPTVNHRDGAFYIIDGQHRIEALRAIGWGDQQIQCWTYEDLTDDEMADKFDVLNDTLQVNSLDKYRIRVAAGRPIESDIDRILRSHGLCISREKIPGAIMAPTTVRKLYTRSGAKALARTLKIIRDAYGDAGLEAAVIDGIGLVVTRYNGQLDDQHFVDKLGSAHGGVNGLLGRAEQTRRATGNQRGQCVAATAIDLYNRGQRGKSRLPDWWKAEA